MPVEGRRVVSSDKQTEKTESTSNSVVSPSAKIRLANSNISEHPLGEISKLSTKRILILDDEPASSRLLSELLSELNLSLDLVLVSSGEEALDLLKNQKFDLIVTDYEMPKMNGEEFVKEAIKLCETPIILHSTHHKLFEKKEENCIFLCRVKKELDIKKTLNTFEKLLGVLKSNNSNHVCDSCSNRTCKEDKGK